jgi:hypothetical protein
MPKMTVLEMTQDILNDMDSDAVSSINDTLEALQVASILETTYFEILDLRDQWDHLGQLGQLTSSGDSDLPTHMTLADNIQKLEWVKYNAKTAVADKAKYTDMVYYEPREFMDKVNSRDSTDSAIKLVTDPDSSVILHIWNDRLPTFYTTFDDKTLIFDAFLLTLDATLTTAKSQWYGYVEPTFSKVDGFVADLPSKLFSYYLSEAKSVCFNALKQSPNAKEEQRSRRQRFQISREKRRNVGGGITYPNFGRGPKK